MRLGFHIISDNKNDSAYYISKINYVLSIKRINPKEKRKFLDLEYYIENSQSQKKFLQWIQAQNQESNELLLYMTLSKSKFKT